MTAGADDGSMIVELALPALRSASSISAGDNPLLSKNDTFFDSGLEATCGSVKNFTAFSTSGPAKATPESATILAQIFESIVNCVLANQIPSLMRSSSSADTQTITYVISAARAIIYDVANY